MKNIKINQVEGFESYNDYVLYEDGTIISHKKGKETLIKGYDNGKGYLLVDLHYKYKRGVKIHRLIALAFVPNPNNKPQVNHINGDKSDNRAINLEWVTNSENQLHANKFGLRQYKYDHTKEHKHVKQHSLDGTFIKEYTSIGTACIEVFGQYNKTKVNNIYHCCVGKHGKYNVKQAYGFKWSFKQ